MALTTPARILELAPTANPLDTAPAWVDITQRLRAGSVKRGRQHEIGTFQAGTMDVTLDNRDGALNGWNTQSPYYAGGTGLQPFKPVRLRAAWAGTTYPVWRGFVESFGPRWDDAVNSEVELRCVDAFKLLEMATIDRSGYFDRVKADGASHFWGLDELASSLNFADAIGTNMLRTGGVQLQLDDASLLFGDSGLSKYFFANQFRQLIGDQLVSRDASFSVEFVIKVSGTPTSGCVVIGQGPGYASYEWYVSVGSGASGGVDFSAYVAGGTDGATTIAGTNGFSGSIFDNKPHHVCCTHGPSTDVIYVDGLAVSAPYVHHGGAPVVKSGSAFTVGDEYRPLYPLNTFVGELDGVAYYPVELSAATVAAHASLALTPWTGDTSGARVNRVLDLIGWPASWRAVDAGLSVMAPMQSGDLGASALSYLQSVELSELGALFMSADGNVVFHQRDKILKTPYTVSQLTLGPSDEPYELDGTTPVGDDTQIKNEVTCQRIGGRSVTVSDAPSQSAFGLRTLNETSLLNTSDTEVSDRAYYRLYSLKGYGVRTERVRVRPADDAATLMPQVLTRDLRDRITFVRTFIGQGDALTQPSLVEGIEHRMTEDDWTTDYALERAPDAFWVLGTSVLATQTRVAA